MGYSNINHLGHDQNSITEARIKEQDGAKLIATSVKAEEKSTIFNKLAEIQLEMLHDRQIEKMKPVHEACQSDDESWKG